MIEFLWPWLLLLLPLPVLIYFIVTPASRDDVALFVPFFSFISGYSEDSSTNPRFRFLRRLLLIFIWLCLVLAGTRPQYIGEPIELPISGRDLLLAVDVSGSMGYEDMELRGNRATRLAIVKHVVGDFVARRKGDRLGLILFGSNAYLQTPLTFDRVTVRTLLEESPVGIAGQKTAVGDAIGLAVKRLKDRPAENRVLILLTDGVNTAGEVDPIQAAKLAASEGIRIHTIGFGAEEMIVPGFFSNRKINPSAELDSETLSKIAQTTGGIFQRAMSSDELKKIYRAIETLEPIKQDPDMYRPVKSLYFWPLSLAILISLIYAIAYSRPVTSLSDLKIRRRQNVTDSKQ